MVNRTGRSLGNRRGRSRLGCLFMLLVLAAAGYYGTEVGGAYLRYWRMKDAMQSEARLAPSIGDDVIRRRLLAKVAELRLPPEAKRIRIQRRVRPREIVIRTSWTDTIELPFYVWSKTFSPEARARL